jgi:hypothetical protein
MFLTLVLVVLLFLLLTSPAFRPGLKDQTARGVDGGRIMIANRLAWKAFFQEASDFVASAALNLLS